MRDLLARVCAHTALLAAVYAAGPRSAELAAWALLFALAAALVATAPRRRHRTLHEALGDPGRAR